jgi:4-amino-4-deoxy-L-arabinose transferase-like glycosyltransferase
VIAASSRPFFNALRPKPGALLSKNPMPDEDSDAQFNASQNHRIGLGEEKWSWFLGLVCLILIFSSLGSAALFEPDEGRNAEKAREILILGDWLTPHQNFIPALDKPIFFHWLVALLFNLFGISEWSARLPSALAALGCVFLVYRFARLQWGPWEARWSCLVLITSAEFYVLSRVVIFDMTLTFFIALALFSFYALTQNDDTGSRKAQSLLLYGALGAATLVKGPIGLIVPAMIMFFYLLLTRRWVLLRRLNFPLGTIVYFTVVAPWYLSVEFRNPGYLRYFLWEEHVVRYMTPQFGKTETWYYFFYVLGVGFLPWSFLLPLTVKNLWKSTFDDAHLFLVLWAVLPFLFFSASNSKLAHYILPIYPAVAILTGQALAAKMRQSVVGRSWVLYIPGIFAVGFILYLLMGVAWPNLLAREIRATVIEKTSSVALYGTILLLVFAVFVVRDSQNTRKDSGMAYVCMTIGLALFFLVVGQIMVAASFHRASKLLAAQAVPLITREDRLVFYDTYIEGLPFYLHVDKPIWLIQSPEKGDVMGSYYAAERRRAPAERFGQVLFSFQEFAERWKKNEQPLKVFVKEKNLDRLSRDIGGAPRLLMRLNDYLLVTSR